MIAYLSGRVVGVLENQVILKLPSGVGYLAWVSPKKNYMQNENIDFYVWEVLRENKSELYAFESLDDRHWAEKLTKVSGVGPKVAANLIYSLGWEKILQSIQLNDVSNFTGVKGLGLKTAKKIVLELKGATTDLDILQRTEMGSNQTSIDFTDTLSNLGYKRGEIVLTITKLKKAGLWEQENLITLVKKGLEIIGKK